MALFSPTAVGLAIITIVIIKIFGSKKSARQSGGADTSLISEVVDAHADFTAEVFSLAVFGKETVGPILLMERGEPVEVKIVDEEIYVYINSRKVGETKIPEGSHIEEALKAGVPFEAYLGGRNDREATPKFVIISVIVFYKLPGVAPSTVTLA